METICSNECEYCVHGSAVPDEKQKVKIYCSARDKYYIFGQYISCDNFEKDKKKFEEITKKA